MIRIGIIGGAGYTAGELIRLLLAHPQARIVFVHSTSNAGNRLADVHGGLEGDTEMRLSDAYDLQAIDVLFLCSAHGESRKWMEANTVPAGVKVIDLAQDFRDESDGFVYGLPELNRDRIRTAQRVANPGCFATAIQLALLPLAAAGLLTDEVHVTAVTGSTGAGVKPSATTHFSWRSDNISVYKAFTHATTRNIDLKQVVNTNKALVGVSKYGDKLHIVSVIDNLLKGASGQAVQNMNLMFGLDETAGLRLKASAF